ncbi:hypothetical protein EIP91_011839 [Steccherinum ochraceum]|uniref:NmrA-like domain-containing protein n=1 Tax=Steccherinum ochraceum TaxID=92696 RepID=A0A4R0RP69_9APHY|nr:hypothetical protein EIP91_011839 [Steccherinum ochraceum]
MSSLPKTILFLGTTGYIGGSVLDALLDHPKASEFDITAYFRSAEKAQKCERLVGVKGISGSLDVVQEAAAKADMIVNCASSDDIPLAEAILAGAKRHLEVSKVATVLLHTYATDKVLDDTDTATINELPSTQWHRAVDVLNLKASDEGYITLYTVVPGLIFGLATGRFVEAGLQRSIPTGELFIALEVLKRGAPGIIGPMKNTWDFVEVHDIADLFVLVLDAIISGKKIASGADGNYFGENGFMELGPYFRGVGQALYELRAIKSAEATQFTPEELKGDFGSVYIHLGNNARISGTRSRSLGWKPKVPAEAVVGKIRDDMKVLLESMKASGV